MLLKLCPGNDVSFPRVQGDPCFLHLHIEGEEVCIPLYIHPERSRYDIFPFNSSCNRSTFHQQSIGADIRHPVSGLLHTQLCKLIKIVSLTLLSLRINCEIIISIIRRLGFLKTF